MTTALDLVEDDLVTLAATLRAAFALIAGHPGKTNKEDGAMLSDVGLILTGAARRLEDFYEKLDGQELQHDRPRHAN